MKSEIKLTVDISDMDNDKDKDKDRDLGMNILNVKSETSHDKEESYTLENSSWAYSLDNVNEDLLTKNSTEALYSDPLQATIYHIVANALDEHTRLNITDPIYIEMPSINHPYIYICDRGRGLDTQSIQKYINLYSTDKKESLNSLTGNSEATRSNINNLQTNFDFIGLNGLGAKAFESYTDRCVIESKVGDKYYKFISIKEEINFQLDNGEEETRSHSYIKVEQEKDYTNEFDKYFLIESDEITKQENKLQNKEKTITAENSLPPVVITPVKYEGNFSRISIKIKYRDLAKVEDIVKILINLSNRNIEVFQDNSYQLLSKNKIDFLSNKNKSFIYPCLFDKEPELEFLYSNAFILFTLASGIPLELNSSLRSKIYEYMTYTYKTNKNSKVSKFFFKDFLSSNKKTYCKNIIVLNLKAKDLIFNVSKEDIIDNESNFELIKTELVNLIETIADKESYDSKTEFYLSQAHYCLGLIRSNFNAGTWNIDRKDYSHISKINLKDNGGIKNIPISVKQEEINLLTELDTDKNNAFYTYETYNLVNNKKFYRELNRYLLETKKVKTIFCISENFKNISKPTIPGINEKPIEVFKDFSSDKDYILDKDFLRYCKNKNIKIPGLFAVSKNELELIKDVELKVLLSDISNETELLSENTNVFSKKKGINSLNLETEKWIISKDILNKYRVREVLNYEEIYVDKEDLKNCLFVIDEDSSPKRFFNYLGKNQSLDNCKSEIFIDKSQENQSSNQNSLNSQNNLNNKFYELINIPNYSVYDLISYLNKNINVFIISREEYIRIHEKDPYILNDSLNPLKIISQEVNCVNSFLIKLNSFLNKFDSGDGLTYWFDFNSYIDLLCVSFKSGEFCFINNSLKNLPISGWNFKLEKLYFEKILKKLIQLIFKSKLKVNEKLEFIYYLDRKISQEEKYYGGGREKRRMAELIEKIDLDEFNTEDIQLERFINSLSKLLNNTNSFKAASEFYIEINDFLKDINITNREV